MPQGYHEPPDPRTGKALDHSKNATKGKQADVSNSEVVQAKPKPTPVKLFDYDGVEGVKDKLREGLDFPFVRVESSILGGKENVSILVTVSKDSKSEWPHGILQNSCYAQIHILNNGTVEHFAGWRLKLRKFKGKNIEQVIEKINNIKMKE